MPFETVTFVNQLSLSNPAGSDDRSTAAAHLRLIKYTLKNSFPNISGSMAVTQAELATLAGNSLTVKDAFSAISLSASAYEADCNRLSATTAAAQALADTARSIILHSTMSVCLSATSAHTLITGLSSTTAKRITLLLDNMNNISDYQTFRVSPLYANGSVVGGPGMTARIEGGPSSNIVSATGGASEAYYYPNTNADGGMTVFARVDIQRTSSAGTSWDLTLRGACWSSSGKYCTLIGHQRVSTTSGTIDGIGLFTNDDCSSGVARLWVEG